MLAKRRKPYIIEDAAPPSGANNWWVENFGIKSVAYYPLRAKDKMIGFLNVVALEERRKFSREEIETLSAIATQAAVIIDNARLYEQQQEQRAARRSPGKRADGRGIDAEPQEGAGAVVPGSR